MSERTSRITALEAVLGKGIDIVSGKWDAIYDLDDEIAWVKEAEAVLGPASQLPPMGEEGVRHKISSVPSGAEYGTQEPPTPSVSVEELADLLCQVWDSSKSGPTIRGNAERAAKAIVSHLRSAQTIGGEDAADVAAASEALADFDKNGGTSLDDLKAELGLRR